MTRSGPCFLLYVPSIFRPGNRGSQTSPTRPSRLSRRRWALNNKSYWSADEEVTACMLYNRSLMVTFRKHHCRACGKVICQHCSSYVGSEHVFEDFTVRENQSYILA